MKRFLFILAIALAAIAAPLRAAAQSHEEASAADIAKAVDSVADQASDDAGLDEALDELGLEGDLDKAHAEAPVVKDDADPKNHAKDIIFEHLGDAYGWEVPFDHHHRIPLPCIVLPKDGGICVFSSAKVQHGEYTCDKGTFKIATEAEAEEYHVRAGKLVQVIQGADGQIEYYRPWWFDFSITKNVAALFVSILLVCGLILWLAGWYRRKGLKAPRKGLGAIEALVGFIYQGVVVSTLGENAKRFAPYLLTAFFFIFGMNLLGLVVVFPGGANLTGNIAITLVMAILTFAVTNIFGTKEYWKEIFWPDVPLFLKFPLPIMPVIEVFGMFTKPAALTVRLMANMMGGHMIVIVLTLLIFIFYYMNPVAGGATTVVSVIFSVFMLLIDVLVSFIQAYVFTMLSTIFISLAQVKEHHAGHEAECDPATDPNCEHLSEEELQRRRRTQLVHEKELHAARKEALKKKGEASA